MQVPVKTKLSYGVGQFSQGVKTSAFYWFLVFYYNQIEGLSPELVGLAAFMALIVDAVTDPVVGQMSDNWHSKKWGRRHGFMAIAGIPFGLSMFMLFNPPAGLSETALFLWLFCWASLARTFMTMFYVPHLSLGAELSKDYSERTSIAGYRTFFSYLGNFVFVAIGLLFILSPDKGGMLYSEGYKWIGLWAGILCAAAVLITTYTTMHVVQHTDKKPDQKKSAWYLAFVELTLLLRLRSFRYYMAAIIAFMASAGMVQSLLAYIAKFYWEFNETQLFINAVVVIIALYPSKLLADWAGKKFDKKWAAILLFGSGIIIGSTPVTLRLFDLMPANGTDALFHLIVLIYMINQTLVIAGLIIAGSMIADMADEYESISNKRQEGIFFAAYSFLEKSSFGIGALLSGFVLGIIQFPNNAIPGEVNSVVLFNLGVAAGPVYCSLALVTILCFMGYSLDRKSVSSIQQKNA